MKHIVFYKSSRTVCPLCGGMLCTVKSDDLILNCIDCGMFLKAIGNGHAEAELEFEEVQIGE